MKRKKLNLYLSKLMMLLIPISTYGNKKNNVLENEFIKIILNKGPQDQGRFSIETTNGDPLNLSDNNQLLIYGRPIPWTSYTTIKIDDQNFIFGGPSKKTQRRTGKKVKFGEIISQKKEPESLETVVKFDKILISFLVRKFFGFGAMVILEEARLARSVLKIRFNVSRFVSTIISSNIENPSCLYSIKGFF